jgi:alpha-galactosidase
LHPDEILAVSDSTNRRDFLKWVAGATVIGHTGALSAGERRDAETPASAAIGDGVLRIEMDTAMRSQLWRSGPGGVHDIPLTRAQGSEYLVLADGRRIDEFTLHEQTQRSIDGPHGPGRALTIVGTSAAQIEKTVRLEMWDRYPGFAILHVSYTNRAAQPIALGSWHSAEVTLLSSANGTPDEPEFWSYCGSTHEDRRDWVQPMRAGFAQENFMGMTASDYGGGTPIVDVWRRDCGLAVGHLEPAPKLVSLPVKRLAEGASLGIGAKIKRTLAPGESLDTPEIFIATHTGDYFVTLDAYRRIMGERGLTPAPPPDAAYESIWCAWGYERQCTPKLIEDTLPKVKDLGLKWAVIDDGWQSNVGDWNLDAEKFPQGTPDMRRLVDKIRAESLKPRLWVAPLAAAPGSDLLHDHSDMLLLDRNGAPQLVSWWNSFYLCPAYEKTVEYHRTLVRRFIGEWGFAGLKIDGQHLNGVAPCYNPKHRHARPEESVEKLPDLFHAMFEATRAIDPAVVMELCPCGTAYSFFDFPFVNQAPASDPESSWQVRHKGKTLKALMGPSAAFAGDHVELSDGKDDFASTVGIGAVVSTKFTWPKDPKPKDSFLLTPQKEVLWRKWIALYNELLLPKGIYRGDLYDIGFDRPEAHVVERSGRFYYAFYARNFQGSVPIRGLPKGRYRLRDYFNDRDLGELIAPDGRLSVAFDHFLVLEAHPA